MTVRTIDEIFRDFVIDVFRHQGRFILTSLTFVIR
ncbi:hypothetical protein DK54_1655 [Brucella abortus]|nr:hypothetical protein DO78_893 [Brucella abortus]AIJ61446.1 hypothetical protein DK53_971 [Brucella abortus bv. 9 str. C68]AIJ64883.1 hypothetical protein DO74_902 [Brucella abortus bv. 6 str. 870]ENP33353.1 hypothetical protein C084_00826 [Brucella abortus 64/122]ENR45911.1 hypothetical protein B993_00671 [Brucella abortus 355/78]ENR57759.1 hypothetical protein B994_00671 [Brucella abortus 63/138]ENR60292.1 hypothetical protein B992_01257 [Brucella abortus 63/144]ENS03692.1 hypothetical p